MSSSNQPTAGDPRPREDRPEDHGHERHPGGPAPRTDVASQAPDGSRNPGDSRTVPVAANPYQPYGQPTGRWEYVPGSPEDARRQLEASKSTDVSLVLGILSVTVLPILAPFAVWQASKAEKLGGRATAGKVLGWVGVALLILGIVWIAFILTIWGFAFSELQQEMSSSRV